MSKLLFSSAPGKLHCEFSICDFLPSTMQRYLDWTFFESLSYVSVQKGQSPVTANWPVTGRTSCLFRNGREGEVVS